jgi:hypothetical protein
MLLAKKVTNQTTASVPSVTPTRARRQEEAMHQATRAGAPRDRLSSSSRAILLLGRDGGKGMAEESG